MVESAMGLSRGKFLGYNFDLQTIEFTMFDGSTGVRCAVETAAMDEFERPRPPTIRSVSASSSMTNTICSSCPIVF